MKATHVTPLAVSCILVDSPDVYGVALPKIIIIGAPKRLISERFLHLARPFGSRKGLFLTSEWLDQGRTAL